MSIKPTTPMDSTERAPFLVPFLAALAFGIPASLLWHFVTGKYGIVVSLATILVGLSCGFGAKLSARGYHPAGAAIIATLLLIVINISLVTLQVLAAETGQTFVTTLSTLVSQGNFTDFANDCLRVTGQRGFIRYPIALYAAYRVSNAA
jgi:hypothetical protein